MAPKPEPPEEAPDESWMATFADMVTLLMAFFVMLAAWHAEQSLRIRFDRFT